ncbi:hypothetical protein LCGC14_2185790 [marine sediment metagenome]|uniref:Uncharacterized protein n=1 Tax=marine sediment metagenome TaxID=412755 RepID=A0A0F9FYF2_9ZZZZ
MKLTNPKAKPEYESDFYKILENIIRNIRTQTIYKDWIQEIPEKTMQKISIMVNDPNFEHIFKIYFKDLVNS